ncbi:MAG: DNA-binding protein WhiA [Firmicutes bacterium]|nr:DNA-binding protein WhiA [Bacillota bacterium]
MSFTSIVKNEVSKLHVEKIEAIALLSSIITHSEKTEKVIKITTENSSLARTIFKEIKEMFGTVPKITVRKGYNYNKNYIYILEINNNVKTILNSLGLYADDILNIPKDYIVDDIDSIRAYIRGLFLICGSINDPKKSRYHLEFLVSSEKYAEFIINLLNTFDLNSKYIKRDNKYMVYVKESEKIGDFLRIINATNALLYYEDIRIYRDHKNMTNRLNNCEQANVDKIVMTANKQVNDIELIKNECGLDVLDDKARVVAEYRLKYREASLTELSEIISIETGTSITKSGIHHRMKKIEEVASRLKR